MGTHIYRRQGWTQEVINQIVMQMMQPIINRVYQKQYQVLVSESKHVKKDKKSQE
jgi:hypothetical protein